MRAQIDPPLAPREWQLAALVAQAKSNKQIAFELSLKESTIKQYLNRAYGKLAIANRTQLAVWFVSQPKSAHER